MSIWVILPAVLRHENGTRPSLDEPIAIALNEILPQHDIILLGAGHSNAHIIRMWRMQPIPNARLTCVSDHLDATYSGMLAGTLAGQYPAEAMTIDLVRLCASCGVRLIHGRVDGLDLKNRRLSMSDRNSIAFDLLSIGIGSRPSIPEGCEAGLSIKPMQTFLQRLRKAIEQQASQVQDRPLEFVVVGGGAAGVEICCCLQEFLKQQFPKLLQIQITLVEANATVLSGMPPRTQQLAKKELERRGIALKLGSRVRHSGSQNALVRENGETLPADVTIWATSAQPSPLIEQLGLPLDQRGFLLTRDTLQSTGSDDVFAVGDAGSVEGMDYAKAGVYAVRQGPILWENLKRKVAGEPLNRWKPQAKFLSLIGTGDDRAIMTYHGMSMHNTLSWKLKDWIDSRFMAMYQEYKPPAMMSAAPVPQEYDISMQCGGCGSKASAGVLQKSLPTLNQQEYKHVHLGLETPDDIALLAHPSTGAIAASTDFFSAFVDEPYLLGRIAALNALSDFYAKGATPSAALAIAVLPPGAETKQALLLEDLLAGANREFQPAGVPIVGGHSIVGPKLTFGFTLLGSAGASEVTRKSDLSPDDLLVLTKPLGTGVLLAAHMQAACRSEWWQTLTASMLQSNREPADKARQIGVSAATDITGFGLAGHLSEMLKPKGLACELKLGSLPVLPGTKELLERGFESTLAPSNREAVHNIVEYSTVVDPAESNILFDPQTSGGLLLSVPKNKLDALLSSLGDHAMVIGNVVPNPSKQPSIRVVP